MQVGEMEGKHDLIKYKDIWVLFPGLLLTLVELFNLCDFPFPNL